MSSPLELFSLLPQRTLWPLKSHKSKYGEGSCFNKESRCSVFKVIEGGILIEHIVISLSNVTETAVA